MLECKQMIYLLKQNQGTTKKYFNIKYFFLQERKALSLSPKKTDQYMDIFNKD